MSNLSTLVYKYLSTSFAGLDWEQGSVVRELVAEPLINLAETVNTAINGAYTQLDIQGMLDNPGANAAAIDNLFNTLGLATPELKKSTGTVKIFTASDEDLQIPASSLFTYQNFTFNSEGSLMAVRNPTQAGEIKLHQVGINAFYAIVPVVSTDYGVNLGAGTELTWNNLGPGVYSVVVDSAITGGVGSYTPAQQINAIRQQLFPLALTCRESVLAAINYYLPDSAVDCMFDTNIGSIPSLYVKTSAMPQTWTIAVPANTTKTEGGGADQRTVYSTTIQSTGIIAVLGINEDPTLTDFITLNKASSIEIKANVQIDNVQVYGLQNIGAVQSVLDRFMTGTGVALRAVAPIALELNIDVPISDGSVTNDLLNRLSTAVNYSLLNTGTVGDGTITPILTAAGLTPAAAGTYTLTNPITGERTQALVSCNAAPFMQTGKPYAIYTSVDRIKCELI